MLASVSFSSSKTPIDQQMLKFNHIHTVFDEDFCPPMFCREHPSQVPASNPIPVTIPGRMKRIGDQLTKDKKLSKWAKTEVIARKKAGGPKETKGVTVSSTPRRLRSGKRV
ncbi:hypothetical protein B0H13DRAFT_1894521 [Mycena leptocephala]|nr:hypothetical protein B0H13DRAFT_1894521 [Mycena leptocephala]